VACAVLWHNKLLMCRRAQEPALGQWNAPTGFLEIGETLQEAAVRETLEETGVSIDPAELDLYAIINMVGIEQVVVVFRTDLHTEPRLRPGCECLEAAFMSEEEIRRIDLAWPDSMRTLMQIFFDQQRSERFGIHLMNIGLKKGDTLRSRKYAICASPFEIETKL
jgi:ADP-ribose pyrophosphatase YjhB (NUDIX family)